MGGFLLRKAGAALIVVETKVDKLVENNKGK
jgi:hypothetical protein